MKTSYSLLALVALITLTGMITTDVLLKRQYTKIDWSDPYQTFERRALPAVRHLVIEAAPIAEVVVEQNPTAQALLLPAMASSYRTQQRGDTLVVSFTMNYTGEKRSPRDNSWYELPAGLVLRLPTIESVRMTNGCLTLRKMALDSLAVSLENTRLRTQQMTVKDALGIIADQNSFAMLGPERYPSLQAVIRDSSGLQLTNTQLGMLTTELSPKAEIQLSGQALKWLK